MWTKDQKIHAIQLCRRHGLDDAMRKLVLRQIPGAMFDRDGNPIASSGDPTMTSARLTNADFDAFKRMITGRDVDPHARERWKARRIANTLELAGLLEPEGVGLLGWIDKRIAPGKGLADLNAGQVYALIESLKSYGTRNGVEWKSDHLTTKTRSTPSPA